MTQVTVEVPQGLEDRFLAEVPSVLAEIESKAKREEMLRQIGADDQAMLDYLDHACMGAKNNRYDSKSTSDE